MDEFSNFAGLLQDIGYCNRGAGGRGGGAGGLFQGVGGRQRAGAKSFCLSVRQNRMF